MERLLERQGQKEAGEQLDAGLHDPQLLQEAAPIAIQSFGFGLLARGVIPALVTLGMVDVHPCIMPARTPSNVVTPRPVALISPAGRRSGRRRRIPCRRAPV